MSNTFITVDRRGICAPGRTLDLLCPEGVTDLRTRGQSGADLAAMIECLSSTQPRLFTDRYPEGLSAHGVLYLHALAHPGDQEIPADIHDNAKIEHFVETVRGSLGDPRPASRFQSMFAWESIEDIDLGTMAPNPTDRFPVYEVTADSYFKKDMSLLNHLGAVRYWAGDAGTHPVWEILLPLPTHVGNLVGHVSQSTYHAQNRNRAQ